MANVALVYPPDCSRRHKRHPPYWDHGPDLQIAYLSLGLGYVASFLRASGHRVTLLDGLLFRTPLSEIVERLRAGRYDVIGVSFSAHETVADGLLVIDGIAGCPAHLTVGGNYATFEAPAILANARRVDSVVVGEGEETMLALVQALERGESLHGVEGIAFREHGAILQTPRRQRRKNLDDLPLPARDAQRPSPPRPQVPILASRGCYADCSFCYNRGFYGSGIVVRRSPAKVVEEIRLLADQYRTDRFIFEDLVLADRSPRSVRWVEEFEREVRDQGLDIRFSAMLRVDDCVPKLLVPLRRAGLSFVFAGAESASDQVLTRLTKRLRVDQIEAAVRCAAEAGVHLELGFIMFEPDMSLDDLIVNYDLIRSHFQRTDHGNLFKRIWPLAGTAVRRQLLDQGRLRLRTWHDEGDYDFLDAEVGAAFSAVMEIKPAFHRMERRYSGVWCAGDEAMVLVGAGRPDLATRQRSVAARVAECMRAKDRVLEEALDELFDHFRTTRTGAVPAAVLERHRVAFDGVGERCRRETAAIRSAFATAPAPAEPVSA